LYFQIQFVFVIILSISISPILFETSFAQQEMSPHYQWKKFADPDTLICKQGYLLLQKNDGNPACITPSTYLKLIDRGYGDYDSSIMSKRPEMMNHLMQNITSNESLMYHWHDMLQRNPSMMVQTMNNWIIQMKDNPEFLKNMLGPMTSEPKLREKMIETMKNHPHMEDSLKGHSKWMNSIHQPMMGSGMGQGMMPNTECAWCPNYQMSTSHEHSNGFANSDRMMDMMHDMWINSGMKEDMHTLMLENSSHIALMSEHMMKPMLDAVMDDEELRAKMIDLMLEHHDFMDSIRHNNPTSR
jgi:hypothetical protein